MLKISLVAFFLSLRPFGRNHIIIDSTDEIPRSSK